MSAYIIRRVLTMVPVALFASIILFALLKLTPGDPVRIQLGEQVNAETEQALRAELGLDQTYPVQYARWLGRVVRGDFGTSIRNGAPVAQEIAERIPATLQLGVTALLLSVFIAVPVGVLAAVFRRSRWSFVVTAFTTVGVSLPSFFFGALLIYFFAAQLRWFPPGGYAAPQQDLGQWFGRLVLPAVTLSLFGAATQTRFIRSGVMDVLHQDYVRTARAKGLAERAVIAGHALRNSLIPSVTLLGLQVGAILQGTFITETIFAWPGVGRLAVQALGARDYPVVQGVVLLAVFVFMAANLLVDVVYAYLDPRINYGNRR